MMSGASQLAMRQLDEALIAGDVALTASTAKRLARTRRAHVVGRLLEVLRGDDNSLSKNAAAVALGDLRESRALPVLMDLIRRAENRDRRGTFVYALWELPWERRFATTVASLVCDENFEVREMAVKAFEQRVEHLSSAQRLQITNYLTRRLYRSSLSAEAGEAAAHVIGVLAEHELGERAQTKRRSA